MKSKRVFPETVEVNRRHYLRVRRDANSLQYLLRHLQFVDNDGTALALLIDLGQISNPSQGLATRKKLLQYLDKLQQNDLAR